MRLTQFVNVEPMTTRGGNACQSINYVGPTRGNVRIVWK